jgi:hypothetical protein
VEDTETLRRTRSETNSQGHRGSGDHRAAGPTGPQGCVPVQAGTLAYRTVGRPFRLRGGLAALLLATLARAQQATPPATAFAAVLPEIKQRTPIPILLPAHLPPLLGRAVFASEEATATGYTIRLESEPDCNQAEVCFVGVLKAQKGGVFSFPDAVQIDKVIQGRYQPAVCSGTCAPPAIEWKLNGVLYTVQLNLKARSDREQRTALLQLAESATRSGAR